MLHPRTVEFCSRQGRLDRARQVGARGHDEAPPPPRGTAERYLIFKGNGRVEVGDLSPTDVGPGDVVLIPPDCPQRITNTGEEDLIFLAVCTPRFTPDRYEETEETPEG